MATITPVAALSRSSVTPAAASSGGDTLNIGSAQRCTLHIINGSGSAVTVTLAGVNTCNLGATHNVVVTCPAGQTTEIGINTNDPATAATITSSGTVGITYSSATSVTVYATTS